MNERELYDAAEAKLQAWLEALVRGELTSAAYYSNDLEVLTRRIVKLTHNLLEESLNAQTTSGADPSPGVPPEERG